MAGSPALQILPGSANLIGGRSVTLKNVPSRTVQGMKFPGAPYGLKMACGENPKRVYGEQGPDAIDPHGQFRGRPRRPGSRPRNMHDGRPRNPRSRHGHARGVLDGEILVQNHCYRADEMAQVIDMAKEFGYKVTAFHHAVEGYKIADLLREADVCSAVWADWYGFKMEAYDAIPENVALLHNAGACVMIHSDDENGIQRLNQEAAKAQAAGRRMGIDIPDAQVIEWLTFNPAKAMGIDRQTGSLEPGKMADVVLWNGNPLSVYSRPEKVWIDGALLYDANDPKLPPGERFRAWPARRRRREMKRLILLLTAAFGLAAPASGQDFAIVNATLAIGDGGDPVADATVVVRGGKIAAAGSAVMSRRAFQ